MGRRHGISGNRSRPSRSVCPPPPSSGRGEIVGSVLLELLWTIPAFAAGVGLIIAIGVYLNARSALQDAVSSGLALAVTRADTEAPLRDLFSSGVSEETFMRLLVSRELQSKDLTGLQEVGYGSTSYRVSSVDEASGEVRVRLKPLLSAPRRPAELMSMTYIAQALEVHTLGDVRFPCPPNETTPGCLTCRFLPGSGAGSVVANNAFWAAESAFPDPILTRLLPGPGGNLREEVLSQRMSVLCRYYPRHALLELLSALAHGVGLTNFSLGAVTAAAAIDVR